MEDARKAGRLAPTGVTKQITGLFALARRRSHLGPALAHTNLKRRTTLTGSQVAVTVKHGRHVTDAGAPYVVNGRGIYHYLDCLYDRLESAGRQDDAVAVAEAFTKEDGTYAWQARADRAATAEFAREARLATLEKARTDETHAHL